MTRRTWLALGIVVVLACGGKTVGSGTETDGGASGDASSSGGGSGSGSDSGSGVDSPVTFEDAVTMRDTSAAVVCNQGPSGGSSGQGACEIQLTETCSDGTTYQVDCSCPSGTCSCSEMSGMSGSGGSGFPFTGCPTCPGVDQAWNACGFPH